MSSRLNRGPALALLFLALAGCGPAKVVTEYQRDSVIVHVRDSMTVRDTIVLVPVPEGQDRAILPDTDTSRLRTSLAESEAYVSGGRLHHTLKNRSEALLPVRVQYVDRAHSETATKLSTLKTVERVEVEKALSRWQNFLLSLGQATLIAGAAWLAWKLARLMARY